MGYWFGMSWVKSAKLMFHFTICRFIKEDSFQSGVVFYNEEV